jgi:acyl-CoA synthetase (AMP-forming)/AMP-acid ligase II
MTSPCNIAAALPRIAAERPDQIAMRCPGKRGLDGFARYDVALTYRQLDQRSDAIAAGLGKRGIVRGTRTVVMVRPSPEFFLLMFALFKAGAVPVLIDPGIAKSALKKCLAEAEPEAFIGIGLAHFARVILGWARASNRINIVVGRRWFGRGATLKTVEADGANAGPQLADTQADDIAAILFTSGSTGVPKGVTYRHRHFVAQLAMLRDAFGIAPGGVDLPTFPPFALFDPAMGVTSIIPDMDPTRPARAAGDAVRRQARRDRIAARIELRIGQCVVIPAIAAGAAHGDLPTAFACKPRQRGGDVAGFGHVRIVGGPAFRRSGFSRELAPVGATEVATRNCPDEAVATSVAPTRIPPKARGCKPLLQGHYSGCVSRNLRIAGTSTACVSSST